MKKIREAMAFLLITVLVLSLTCVNAFAETNKAEEYYNNVIAKDAVNGVFHLNSIVPDEGNMDQEQFIFDYFFYSKYSNEQYDVTVGRDYDNPDKIMIRISDLENPSSVYSQEIKVAYNPVDSATKTVAEKYIKVLNPEQITDEPKERIINMHDMDMINMLFNTQDDVDDYLLMNYSSEFKKLIENSNLSAEFAPGAGGRGIMSREAMGGMGLVKDGTVYGVSNIFFTAANLFFVPDSTEDSTEAIALAAKIRIEKYLGKEVTVEFSGPINDDMNLDVSILGDIYGGDYDFNSYYNITIDGKTYPFFIFKDGSKMVDISFGTKDIYSGAKITADSPCVPNDSMIKYDVIDKNSTEAKNLLAAFGLTDGHSFDISLSSKTKGTYISKLDDGTFKVYIPLTDELKGKELTAYYKTADGKIEKYAVSVEGDYAVFSTSHFSTYTIGFADGNNTGNTSTGEEKIAKTADTNKIALFGTMMVASLAGVAVLKKKEK